MWCVDQMLNAKNRRNGSPKDGETVYECTNMLLLYLFRSIDIALNTCASSLFVPLGSAKDGVLSIVLAIQGDGVPRAQYY